MNETSAPVNQLPSFRNFFWASVLLSLFGWGGLAILFVITLPTLGPRWLFYFLFMCGVSGVALPVTYFINRRFMTRPPAEGGAIVRESIWVGFYACIMLWMQSGGILNPVMALALAIGFLTVEVLMRIRETSLWKPKGPPNE